MVYMKTKVKRSGRI